MNIAVTLEKKENEQVAEKKFPVRGGSRIRIARLRSVELVSQASQSLTCCPGSKDGYKGPSKTFN